MESKMNLEKNVIRELRRISDKKQIYFLDVLKTYVGYLKEEIGELPQTLEFNKKAYEKTRKYYK